MVSPVATALEDCVVIDLFKENIGAAFIYDGKDAIELRAKLAGKEPTTTYELVGARLQNVVETFKANTSAVTFRNDQTAYADHARYFFELRDYARIARVVEELTD